MTSNNRTKITKAQFLTELKKVKVEYNTRNAYDLNESGGFVADKRKN